MNVFRTPFFLPTLYPQLTWRIKTEARELYLTFDDGPVPGPTEFVLEELKKKNVPATFFCIGDNISKNSGIYRKIKSAGHVVGNHTFHHVSGWKTRTSKYLEDTHHCAAVMARMIPEDTPSRLFRPPYGRITRNQIRQLSAYHIIMWDVLTHDYVSRLSPSACLKGSLRAARPGSIVVFHDSYKAEKNMMHVLPRFIDHFAGLGYTFKSLS